MANEDRWPELCKQVSEDDGLPTRTVGHWSEEKLFFWNRYVDITTRAMVGSPHWKAGLVYVDLFAGPGVCTLKESGRRLPGSPLIAANAPKPFKQIIICEKDADTAEACRTRLQKTPARDRIRFLEGDCNERIGEVASMIPSRALTLAFIDPTGLHARFETIKTLSRCGRVDLLILFPDAYDVVRNVDLYEKQGVESNLDQVLGPDAHWREQWSQLPNQSPDKTRELFTNIYKDQLARRLDYKVFGEKTIKSARGPLYRLIYASKHERGLEFWNKITNKDPSGQQRLF